METLIVRMVSRDHMLVLSSATNFHPPTSRTSGVDLSLLLGLILRLIV